MHVEVAFAGDLGHPDLAPVPAVLGGGWGRHISVEAIRAIRRCHSQTVDARDYCSGRVRVRYAGAGIAAWLMPPV
jgi:hypothetical protein